MFGFRGQLLHRRIKKTVSVRLGHPGLCLESLEERKVLSASSSFQSMNNPDPTVDCFVDYFEGVPQVYCYYDDFGSQVSVSGDVVAVGAPGSNLGWQDSGSAYLFDAHTGSLQMSLEPPDGFLGDRFGSSISISDDQVVVGAPKRDVQTTVGIDAGAAYVFNVTTGVLEYTLYGAGGYDSWFGSSVSINQEYVAVGAPREYIKAGEFNFQAGSAYVFKTSTGEHVATIHNPLPFVFDLFGFSVSVSEKFVLVGAPKKDIGGTFGIDAGAAYLFDAATGELLHTFINPVPTIGSFGYSVSISGDLVAIGAPVNLVLNQNQSGAVYLFDATTGVLLHNLHHPNPNFGGFDWFGSSVSAFGNQVLVGSPQTDVVAPFGFQAGTAYLFDATNGGLLLGLENPEPYVGDHFGSSVAFSDGVIVVGAPDNDIGTGTLVTNVGTVYVMTWATGDLDFDGSVDAADAGVMFANWGMSGLGDLNDDGIVDAADAGILFENWTGDAGPLAVVVPTRRVKLASPITIRQIRQGPIDDVFGQEKFWLSDVLQGYW